MPRMPVRCLFPRPAAEELECREVLSVTFVDSGQDFGIVFVSLADLDGDDDLDILASDGKVWLNDGSGQFTDTYQTSIRWHGHGVALDDIDGDGDIDAVVGEPATMLWLNDGRGDFRDSGQRLGNLHTGVALGDVDGDGDLDAFLAYGGLTAAGAQPKSVWINDGLGNLADSGQRLPGEEDCCGSLWSSNGVTLGDIDGDGDLDAVVGHYAGGSFVWLNDGNGTFTDSGERFDAGCARSSPLVMYDVDGDEDLDVAAVTCNDVQLWLNGGHGELTNSGLQMRFGIDNLYSQAGFAVGDIDGDVLVGNYGNTWLNDAHGNFSKGEAIEGGLLWEAHGSDVDLGDVDGDGDLDAVVSGKLLLNASPRPRPGDANRDLRFDQLDIVQVLQAGKYWTGEPATWREGDWNRDGLFDQTDIVAALQTANYLQGPYAALVAKSQATAVDELFAEVGG